MQPHSLYLHIPFCQHRCGYCDFNTYADLEHLIDDYALALQSEIISFAQIAPEKIPLHTIYFGGGTPSLLPAESVESILQTIRQQFEILPNAEITLEVNPGTVDLDYFKALHHMGINRISMGVQSANQEELRLLERTHGYEDAINAVQWARQAEFDNISIDLIFGLPYQKVSAWQHNLELALGLSPDHISLYALTVEHGTPLQHMVSRGLLPLPDPDAAAEMYEFTMQRVAAEGFQQYEISNWARRSASGELFSSRHNLQYWRNLPYIGMGAGGHGYVNNSRTANVLSPAAYIQRFQNGASRSFPRTAATASITEMSTQMNMSDTMMMGLRLVEEGVSSQLFEQRFGSTLHEIYKKDIDELVDFELLEWGGNDQDILRLTTKGRLLGNQVFMRFV
ncbi:MAG: radical SAM family heme chaperone HemW [Chloroflexota bacterium]